MSLFRAIFKDAGHCEITIFTVTAVSFRDAIDKAINEVAKTSLDLFVAIQDDTVEIVLQRLPSEDTVIGIPLKLKKAQL